MSCTLLQNDKCRLTSLEAQANFSEITKGTPSIAKIQNNEQKQTLKMTKYIIELMIAMKMHKIFNKSSKRTRGDKKQRAYRVVVSLVHYGKVVSYETIKSYHYLSHTLYTWCTHVHLSEKQ